MYLAIITKNNTITKVEHTYARENAAKIIAENLIQEINTHGDLDFLEVCRQIEACGIPTAKEQEAVDIEDLLDTCFEYCYKNNKPMFFQNADTSFIFNVTKNHFTANFVKSSKHSYVKNVNINYTIVPVIEHFDKNIIEGKTIISIYTNSKNQKMVRYIGHGIYSQNLKKYIFTIYNNFEKPINDVIDTIYKTENREYEKQKHKSIECTFEEMLDLYTNLVPSNKSSYITSNETVLPEKYKTVKQLSEKTPSGTYIVL